VFWALWGGESGVGGVGGLNLGEKGWRWMTLPTRVETDSPLSCLNNTPDGSRPVAFWSRQTTDANDDAVHTTANSSSPSSNLFDIGRPSSSYAPDPFTIYTDHQALQYFQTSQRPLPRHVRWSQDLNCRAYRIEYRPAKENCKADALSRRPAGSKWRRRMGERRCFFALSLQSFGSLSVPFLPLCPVSLLTYPGKGCVKSRSRFPEFDLSPLPRCSSRPPPPTVSPRHRTSSLTVGSVVMYVLTPCLETSADS